MQAIYFLIGIIAVAAGAWFYFDATDRAIRSAWLWGVGGLLAAPLVVPFVVLALVYWVTRRTTPPVASGGVATRLYLVVATFSSFLLAAVGVASSIAATILWAVGGRLSSNDYRDLMASSISAAVVGICLWVPHQRTLARRVGTTVADDEFRALYVLRRSAVLTLAFITGATAAISALWFVGGAISAAFQTTYAAAANWAPLAGPFVVSAAGLWFFANLHLRERGSEATARFNALPPPAKVEPHVRPPLVVKRETVESHPNAQPTRPAPAPVLVPTPAPASAAVEPEVKDVVRAPSTYCSACGGRSRPGDRFCRFCGAALSS